MKNNPSKYVKKGDDCPVETANWRDCPEFVEKLNDLGVEGAGNFRLPTEAQWERARRADSTTTYAFGDAIDETKANYGHAILGKTSPVRDRAAFQNRWGLLEVCGDVWEWREDWYGSYEIGGVDPTGSAIGSHRVVRGGSWASDEKECRAAERSGRLPCERSDSVGFRLVMEGAE